MQCSTRKTTKSFSPFRFLRTRNIVFFFLTIYFVIASHQVHHAVHNMIWSLLRFRLLFHRRRLNWRVSFLLLFFLFLIYLFALIYLFSPVMPNIKCVHVYLSICWFRFGICFPFCVFGGGVGVDGWWLLMWSRPLTNSTIQPFAIGPEQVRRRTKLLSLHKNGRNNNSTAVNEGGIHYIIYIVDDGVSDVGGSRCNSSDGYAVMVVVVVVAAAMVIVTRSGNGGLVVSSCLVEMAQR